MLSRRGQGPGMSPEWGLREGACPSQPEQREEGFEVPACLLQVTGPHSGLWVQPALTVPAPAGTCGQQPPAPARRLRWLLGPPAVPHLRGAGLTGWRTPSPHPRWFCLPGRTEKGPPGSPTLKSHSWCAPLPGGLPPHGTSWGCLRGSTEEWSGLGSSGQSADAKGPGVQGAGWG